ncbi:MBL fold metallo-hydrolase [Rhodovulum tesquicola]|uniref:MBL fold metallo-hydrolase n=1 Tax=Rhodovulum tesquicola TaxID=540254 RepID=UPI003F4A67E5
MMDGTRGPIRYPFPDPPAPDSAVRIAEGVLWMRLPLPMALDHVNVYALDDGAGWTVVDTGIASSRSRALWRALMAGPLGGRPVTRVIVTHHHPDHVGLAGWFQSAHGAELWTSRVAWLFARMLQLDEQDRPAPETLVHWRGAGMDPALFAERANQRPFNFADTVAPMPLGFRDMAEGDRIRAGGRDWDVRLGDGHARDHVTLWSRDCNLVIGGDQLLPSSSPNLGVYATEPLNDPVAGWLQSCTRLATHAREDHLVLPGHKLPFTGLPTRLSQLIDNHHGALDRLIAHLDRPRTACDCFPVLYRREIGPAEYVLALVEAVGHLNHLFLTGRARRWQREDGAWLFQRIEGPQA